MNINQIKRGFLIILILTAACAATISAQTETADRGDFKIGFSQSKKARNAKARQAVRDSHEVFAEVVKELNDLFKLPHDIFISFEECGEANAYYDPNEKQIKLCYELIENYRELFKEKGKSADKLDDEVAGAIIFIFFHELGHALVDVLDLPVTGKKEDAVDQLSTVILIEGLDAGEELALSGALAFALEDDDTSEDSSFADEHSFNKQRFFNVICLIYGNNPEKYEPFVTDEILPEERAAGCPAEYEKTKNSWFRLLAPFFKSGNQETAQPSANILLGRWQGVAVKGQSDLEINITTADNQSIKGEVIIKRAFAGKTPFAAIVKNVVSDFACKAYVVSRCTISNLKLFNGKLTGTLIFSNGEDIRHDFALTKTPEE